MKTLIVTSGDYSDYHISAVFTETNRERADTYAQLIGGSVEEYEADMDIPHDPGMDRFTVQMMRDGEHHVSKYGHRLDSTGNKHDEYTTFRTHVDHPRERRSYWCLFVVGYFPSEEHAVRHANELRRQILAGQRPEGVDMGKN